MEFFFIKKFMFLTSCLLIFFNILCESVSAQNSLNCSYGTLSNGFSCVECGTTVVQPNVKIVGGIEAIPNSWPSQVLVVINIKGDYELFGQNVTVSQRFECGGTLISQKTVMTAGHCFIDSFYYEYNGVEFYLPIYFNKYYPTWESMFTIYAGVHNISFLDNPQGLPPGGVKLSVKKVIKYSSFDLSTELDDIQLLVLNDLIEITPSVRFACLPQKYSTTYPDPGTMTYASGWGFLNESESSVPVLLYNVRLTVYNSSYCSSVLTNLPKNWNSQICCGDINGGKDTCQGDSGGPLYSIDPQSKKHIVAGITSTGEGCGRVGKPGIYTRVSYYLDWIMQNWETSNITTASTTSTSKITTKPLTTARTTIRTTTKKLTTTTRKTTTKKTTTRKPTTTTKKPTKKTTKRRKPKTKKKHWMKH